MYAAPLDFIGPIRGKRVLLCGLSEEAVALAEAGAEVYGFDVCDAQVQAVKNLARRLGLRNQTHFQALAYELLPYPDAFFDLAFVQQSDFEARGRELARVLKRDGKAAVMVYSNTW